MRSVLGGIDVKNPTLPTTELLRVSSLKADVAATRLHASFTKATFSAISPHQILVTATPPDLAQIRSAISALDVPLTTPPPVVPASDAVRVTQRAPREVARALEAQLPGLRAAVSGSTVVLRGSNELVARAKTLVASIDVPSFGAPYTEVYRIHSIDAASVADLFTRSFHDISITVDTGINAIAVTTTATQQQRIADAVAQLDPPTGQGGPAGVGGNGTDTELVTLKSAIPGQSGGGPDIVATITQTLQTLAPDVHVVQLPTPGQIALIGPAASIRHARDFIDKIDILPAQVVLDTEVLELDETVAKNIGLQLPTPTLSTTFSEITPVANANGTPAQVLRGQAVTRTPLSLPAELNLAIQNGYGRVLADPRITTLSGHTASIRAGDTISILTTTAGNAGTIASTQVQSFQTGVSLDITPLVDGDGGVTVSLHPVVNSLVGTTNNVPEISTRDTQTVVHLRPEETFVIGGLIQVNDTTAENKIPFLGDLPLLGPLFRNENINNTRNDLVIVVTPHIVTPGNTMSPGPPLPSPPIAQPLPTLAPDAHLPTPSGLLPIPSTAHRTRGKTPTTPAPATPPPSPSPIAAPSPIPSAFAATNIFTFGAAPQSNFAKDSDPVQIFYATLSPTVVANGTSVHLAAVTTTNAATLKLQIGSQTISLGQTGPGQWQTTLPFPLASVPLGQTSLNLSLAASRRDGASATIPVPVNVATP
jgi:type II secretory pathway component GspD/PulD (secretin)